MREKTLCLLLADQGFGVSLSHDVLQNAILNHYDLGGCIMIYKPDKVSKMKGADIIAEYMMKEKIPYMIGYARSRCHWDAGFLLQQAGRHQNCMAPD